MTVSDWGAAQQSAEKVARPHAGWRHWLPAGAAPLPLVSGILDSCLLEWLAIRQRRHALRQPLDQVFVAASHVAVCRALLDTAEGMSGRQVARRGGINHQTCAVALGRLEEVGIVTRQGSGRTQLFRLNRENLLVQDLLIPLLQIDHEVFPRVLRRVGALLVDRCRRALIFGSVARAEERPDSDLDLLLIADGPREQTAARRGGNELHMDLARVKGKLGASARPATTG